MFKKRRRKIQEDDIFDTRRQLTISGDPYDCTLGKFRKRSTEI